MIVATSTLELGIDIGDLDRVIQVDAPRTVASFLQRLGRTGRRPGTSRNMLFLATNSDAFLEAAGVLLLWKRGYVEPVVPPPHPRHLVVQQLLALALQEGAFDSTHWRSWWGAAGASGLMTDADSALEHLRRHQFLVEDGGSLMIGPAAERSFGRRHFMDLLSSFAAERELRVVAGTKEIGFISPLALPRRDSTTQDAVLMNGRAWHVEHVDWQRFVVQVSEVAAKADVKWHSEPIALSFALMRAQRDVLLGETPDVGLTRRATDRLAALRERRASEVSASGLVVQRQGADVHLWTWAGLKANETLGAALGGLEGRSSNDYMVLRELQSSTQIGQAQVQDVLPHVPAEMADELKFSAALPPEAAKRVLAERFVDREGAFDVANRRLTLVDPPPGA